MGNTYNATTFDLYAVGKNPGLLVQKDGDYMISVIFPNLTAQGYGFTSTINTFEYYADNRLRSDGVVTLNEEKFRIALDNHGVLFVDGLIGFMSVAVHLDERYGSFAFTMSDYLSGFVNIPDVILDINYGEEIPGGSFDLEDFIFRAWWIRTYGLTYSRYIYRDRSLHRNGMGLIRNVSGGITAKYVLTYAYTDIGLNANVNYTTATQTLSGSYEAHAIYAFSEDLAKANAFVEEGQEPRGFLAMRPAGRGYGIDLGAAAELRKGWILGLAVTDIGSISWEGSAFSSDFDGYIDISGVIDHQAIDSIAAGIRLDREKKNDFNTPMPTAVRLGVALKFEEMFKRFPGEFLVGIDYNQGLNNEPSNFTEPRFSAGFSYRYRPKWPILIGGYTYDLLGITRGALGLGYTNWLFDIYISTIDIFAIVKGGDRASASLIVRWKILSGRNKNSGPKCF